MTRWTGNGLLWIFFVCLWLGGLVHGLTAVCVFSLTGRSACSPWCFPCYEARFVLFLFAFSDAFSFFSLRRILSLCLFVMLLKACTPLQVSDHCNSV